MKLAHPDWHFTLSLDENVAVNLIIENKALFRQTVCHLMAQAEGKPGPLVLSQKHEPVPFGKHALVISDVFSLDLNGKKAANALYKALLGAARERMIESTYHMQGVVYEWADSLLQQLPLPLGYDEVDLAALMKALNIGFAQDRLQTLTTLSDFVKIMARLLSPDLLVTVGLHTVLTDAECMAFYQTVALEKMRLLNIESAQSGPLLPGETRYLIDNDLCEIYNHEEDTRPL